MIEAKFHKMDGYERRVPGQVEYHLIHSVGLDF